MSDELIARPMSKHWYTLLVKPYVFLKGLETILNPTYSVNVTLCVRFSRFTVRDL